MNTYIYNARPFAATMGSRSRSRGERNWKGGVLVIGRELGIAVVDWILFRDLYTGCNTAGIKDFAASEYGELGGYW